MNSTHRVCASRAFKTNFVNRQPRFAIGWGPLLLAAVSPLVGIARADVVDMNDGRRFEGEIVFQNDAHVRIDTVVATIRTQLTFNKNEVVSVKTAPVPAGFFEPAPPPVSEVKADTAAAAEGFYLEVPIVGEFGDAVQLEGVRAALAYARRNRIPSVVFYIDGNGLADFSEAYAIFALLEVKHPTMKYYAVVKRAVGESLAVLFQCDAVFILPGAEVGGAGAPIGDANVNLKNKSEAVFRRELAYEVSSKLQARGKRGQIAAAMIDPTERLAAWKDASGKVEMGTRPPEGIAGESVIFQTESDHPLLLSESQCVKLGVPLLKSVAGLGDVLGLTTWKRESDYGAKIMKQAADVDARQQASKQAKFDNEVKAIVRRRGVADSALQNGIKRASEWDPTKASYVTYSSRYNWGWGAGGSYDTNFMTNDAQERWRRRTDTAMMYIKQAGDAAVALRSLDVQGEKVGLDPTYKPGELDMIIMDLEARYKDLQADRDKRYN